MMAPRLRALQIVPPVHILCLLLLLVPARASAERATVAVAANFVTTIERLASHFETLAEHDIRVVSGSTGKLYTQIVHGAPFDVFLAADAARPDRLIADGKAAEADRVTYAIGRLVLWSREGSASEALLQSGDIERLAIANPALAPYGAAAMETLEHYGMTGAQEPALVMGQNIAQTVAMLATGNVDHGLVALSIQTQGAFDKIGDTWLVPANAHAPIRQDAVLLTPDNAAAVAFFAFLRSDAARAIITADGYGKADP